MERDKELLLPVEASDSDDIVEEFKLPPPRTRRPKARKAIAEARIAASNPSLLSWKCCLMFILVSIFISGVLVLAFFMLSMQSEINKLSQKIADANVQIRRHDSIEISTKKLMEKLEQYKQKFSKQDLNIKLLVHQILNMNKTIQKISSSNELERRLSTLARDVDSMKTGMASTGGSIAKIQAEILQHDDKFESVLTELKNVKMAIYNSTTKNKTELEKLTRPISAQTQQIRKLKLIIRKVNSTHNRNAQRIATEIYNNRVEVDEKLKKLDIRISTVNETYIGDTVKLKKLLSSYMNKSERDLATHSNGMSFLMNITGALQKKVEHHHKLLTNYTDLEKDVKHCKVLSNIHRHNIQLLEVEVAKHTELMKKNKNISFAYMKDIMQLLNHSKTAEDMIMHHHQQLKEYTDKINSLKSPVGSTPVVSKEPEKTSIVLESTSHPQSSIQPSTQSTLSSAESPTQPPTQPSTQPSTQPPTQPPTQPSSTESVITHAYLKASMPPETPKQSTCPLVCGKGEQCNKTRKGYKCVCAQGYVKLGKYCEDINECLTQNNNNCHVNATCQNTYGSYECVCNEGFVGNGTHCSAKIETSERMSTMFPATIVTTTTEKSTVTINETNLPTNIATVKQPVAVGNENISKISTPSNTTVKADVGVSDTKEGNITESASVDSSSSPAIEKVNDTVVDNPSSTVSPTQKVIISSVPGKDSTKGLPLGTVKPAHSTTTESDEYITPEMPDETGRYSDVPSAFKEKAKKWLNKSLMSNAENFDDSLKSLDTNTKGDYQDDLNNFNG